MSSYNQRVDKTKSLIQEAQDALSELTDEQRALNPDDLKRLSEVLDYADQVVSRTKATLVPDDAWNEVDNHLQALQQEARSQPERFVPGRPRVFASIIGANLAQFPPARGRIPEQQATAAIEKVRAEAEQRIEKLKAELKNLSDNESVLSENISLQGTELEKSMQTHRQELEQAIQAIESQLADERQRIETTTTEQAETFRQAQEEQASEFKAQLEQQKEQIEKADEEFNKRAEDLLNKILEMRDQSAELVGSIGVTGTAERYKGEADDQKDAANNWRWIAVVIAAGAVLVAVWAAATAGSSSEDILPFIGKLAIGIALGGLAAYAAKQSGRHRDREETAKSVQLDLTAFNAFIEPLDKPDQDAERKALGSRIFGQHFIARELKVKDAGPGTIEQIVQAVVERLRVTGGTPPPPTE